MVIIITADRLNKFKFLEDVYTTNCRSYARLALKWLVLDLRVGFKFQFSAYSFVQARRAGQEECQWFHNNSHLLRQTGVMGGDWNQFDSRRSPADGPAPCRTVAQAGMEGSNGDTRLYFALGVL